MRGLNKLYWLKIDIKDIEKEIAEIKKEIATLPTISSPQITGMPRSTDVSNPIERYYLKKEALEEKLTQRCEMLIDKKAKLEVEKARLEGIIENIEDPTIKKMAEMRFVKCKSWEEIGEATNYDRTSCAKKLRKYFEKGEIQ